MTGPCVLCARPVRRRRLCNTHYMRWYRTGSAMPAVKETLSERFVGLVDQLDSAVCWLWQGATRRGYGRFRVDTRNVQAHRFAYELWVGPIPDGHEVDHLCRNTLCVNPAHLEPVTGEENLRRQAAALWTTCRRDHPLTGANVIHDSNGRRRCRRCKNDWQRARAALIKKGA